MKKAFRIALVILGIAAVFYVGYLDQQDQEEMAIEEEIRQAEIDKLHDEVAPNKPAAKPDPY